MNVLPYVYTNPPKDTEIFSCDRVFVLSQIPIAIEKSTSFRATTAGDQKKKSSDFIDAFKDGIQAVDELDKELLSRVMDLKKSIVEESTLIDLNIERLLTAQKT
jgi:hypothetical protein